MIPRSCGYRRRHAPPPPVEQSSPGPTPTRGRFAAPSPDGLACNTSVAVFACTALLWACSGGGNGGTTFGAAEGIGGGTPGSAIGSGGTTGAGGTAAAGSGGSNGAAPGTGGTASAGTGGTPGTGGTRSAGTASSGGAGGAAGAAGAMSIPMYSLRVDAPISGATVGGVVTVSGLAPGFLNVEVSDATHQQPPLAQTAPAADGTFSTTVDTSALASGSTTWTVHAWDSAPGQSFAHEAMLDRPLTIDQAAGGGGTAGAGGCTPRSDAQLCQDAGKNCDTYATTDNCGSSRSASCGSCSGTCTNNVCQTTTGGRNFLLGMFSSGSEITSYSSYLGYHPEVTYNSSYQDDHHKSSCGQPISGLNDINNYPVIISVFTYNADYAGTAQGNHDDCYETLFSGLESKANSIYGVRIDVEFYPQPPAAEFKGSFDRIVSIAKKHLPSRVKYIFNPNWDSGLGADYVPDSADVVGPDAYNNPTWCSGKSSAQCAADKLDPNHPGSIAYWTKIAQQLGKTMALPEWGDDYGDGVYIDAVADWAFDKVLVTPGMSNNVVYLGYWDSNLNEDGHLRNDAKTAFQQRFGNISYTGTYWGPLIPTTSFSNF